jgi:hypothetical protein
VIRAPNKATHKLPCPKVKAVKKATIVTPIIVLEYPFAYLIPLFAAVNNNQIATGSLIINKGLDKPGKNHLRNAPSKMIKIKYSQIPFLSELLTDSLISKINN